MYLETLSVYMVERHLNEKMETRTKLHVWSTFQGRERENVRPMRQERVTLKSCEKTHFFHRTITLFINKIQCQFIYQKI